MTAPSKLSMSTTTTAKSLRPTYATVVVFCSLKLCGEVLKPEASLPVRCQLLDLAKQVVGAVVEGGGEGEGGAGQEPGQ